MHIGLIFLLLEIQNLIILYVISAIYTYLNIFFVWRPCFVKGGAIVNTMYCGIGNRIIFLMLKCILHVIIKGAN